MKRTWIYRTFTIFAARHLFDEKNRPDWWPEGTEYVDANNCKLCTVAISIYGSQTKRNERKRNRTKHNREKTSDENVTDDLAPKFI